tara:strand:- start:393 stop:569 length:177 start_codon:yes stop_codon:yes gene_type:complete
MIKEKFLKKNQKRKEKIYDNTSLHSIKRKSTKMALKRNKRYLSLKDNIINKVVFISNG